jgi:hypothetical protein
MIQHVVSYAYTLSLISLGFDRQCAYLYTANGASIEYVVDSNGDPTIRSNTAIAAANAANRCAPTYALVSDWLYEEHDIKVNTINFFNVENYNKFILWVNIPNETKKREIVSNEFWTSRMDAYNEAIALSISMIPMPVSIPVDPGDPVDPDDPKDPKDPKDPDDPKDPKDPDDPKDPKDPKDPDDPKDPKDPKDPDAPGAPGSAGLT